MPTHMIFVLKTFVHGWTKKSHFFRELTNCDRWVIDVRCQGEETMITPHSQMEAVEQLGQKLSTHTILKHTPGIITTHKNREKGKRQREAS